MSPEKTKEIRITIPEDLFALVVPKETVVHLINAKKEMLLGLRSIIDAKIKALEKIEEKKVTKKKKIAIE
ncbi:MAG: hypothetical protein JSV96_12790 [Candidatus Aminicenantes bacterium]|nr:MAG: hypothetical protein JSV96_12790 [Candidatus Aminicenantes bacterium]